MDMIYLSLLIGIVIGAILGYLFAKNGIAGNYVVKSDFDDAQKVISDLRIENAKRISKEELESAYVSKELYNNNYGLLEEAKASAQYLNDTITGQQQIIIRLTGESNEKLTKLEVEKNYVARESFDIVSRKLSSAETQLASKENDILRLNNELTEQLQKEEHLNDKLNIFKGELEIVHTNMREQFKNIATDVLENKKTVFITENKTQLDTILNPLRTNLTEFKDKIEATRKEDIQELTSLKKEIDLLQKLNVQLSDDAKNLATALKSEVKMQGNWGEDRLNMILEAEGLQKYIDFSREELYRDDEIDKNRKPDFILKLPDNKCIVIDSKVSLTAYVNYFNAATTEEKTEYLKLHLRSITDHINNLADKNYQTLAGLTTPDYVFLFMPVESALTLAMNQNADIFNNALKRKIVLITPTTLVATLKVVKILWQKENQVKNVEEIFRQCGELYNKFVTFLDEMDRIETALTAATKAHADAMYSLKDGAKKGQTIIGRFEAIKKLEAKTNKEMPLKHLREIDLLPDDNELQS
jgi:DNA recombination protein RmuC